jgi:Flp pilus assembly protein TadG
MVRPFFRDERGSVAVEMAIVGPLFILLMLTIVEMTLTLVTQSALDGAARDAVRLLRSGGLAAGGINQQAALFQRVLCDNLSPLVSKATCATNVVFDVEPVSSFGGAAFQHDPPCTQSASSSGSGVPCPFNLGSGGQIVGVQVRYWRPFIVPWVGECLSGSCWSSRDSAQGSSPGTSVMRQTSVAIFRY